VKRREFISLLGGAAVGWPLNAGAQQPQGMRRIGVVSGGTTEEDPEAQANIAAFLQVLRQLGWLAGGNVRVDARLGWG
jgi:putative ABC transport system substrate-binding protein